MLAKLNLIGTALVFIGFGIWGLLAPEAAALKLGLAFRTVDGATALRALYGGYLLGAGLLFALAARRAATVAFGLVAILAIVGPILAARLLGLVIDRNLSPLHLTFAAMEFLSVAITAALLWWDTPARPSG